MSEEEKIATYDREFQERRERIRALLDARASLRASALPAGPTTVYPLLRPPVPRRRWIIRGWPLTPALIIPTLTTAVMRVVAQGWSTPARVHCAVAFVGLVMWAAVFVRRQARAG